MNVIRLCLICLTVSGMQVSMMSKMANLKRRDLVAASFAGKMNEDLKYGLEDRRFLIVFYSYTGNTQYMIDKISSVINQYSKTPVLVERIIAKDIPNSLLIRFKIAVMSLWESSVEIEPIKNDCMQYTDIIVGMPIWLGSIALPVQTYLKQISKKTDLMQKLQQRRCRVHFFVTYNGMDYGTVKRNLEFFIKKNNIPVSSMALWIDKDIKDPVFESSGKLERSVRRALHELLEL